MAIVSFTGPVDESVLRGAGYVVSSRAGGAVSRGRSYAAQPDSADQLAERAGVVSAARAWGTSLSPTDRDSWVETTSCDGLSGFWLWVWLVSALRGGFLFPVPGPPGPLLGPPDVSSCGLATGSGTMPVTVTSAGAASTARAVVMMSRPLPRGRVPVLGDMRTVGVAELGVETDFAAAYVARFGRLPAEDAMFRTDVVVGDPTTLGFACPVTVLCVPGGGGGGCTFAVTGTPSGPSDSVFGEVSIDDTAFPSDHSFEVVSLDSGWPLAVPVNPVNDGSLAGIELTNNNFVEGDQSVEVCINDMVSGLPVCCGTLSFNVPPMFI